jgi:hypothetical protein
VTFSEDPKLEILLEKSGRVLSVNEYTLSQDFTGSTDSFSFTYYSDKPELLRGLELQPVTIRIDGRTQFIGRIDATTRGDNGSAVTCEGRDYLSDLVESNVDPKCILRDGMPLQDAILYLCAPCGITTIESPAERISAKTGKPVNVGLHKLTAAEVKDDKPEAGRGIYQVCEELLARFGLTLQPTIRRSAVVIQPPTYDTASIGRIARTFGEPRKNLVISGRARRDYSSFPTHAVFTGKQGTPVDIGGAKGTISPRWDMFEFLDKYPTEIKTIVRDAIVQGRMSPGETSTATNGALYRLLYFQDPKAKTASHIANSMMRAISDRLKSTLTYECTVRGHSDPITGYTWAPDTMVDVADDMSDINEPLWCKSVTFANSRQSGPTTALTFLRPKTFQIYWDE